MFVFILQAKASGEHNQAFRCHKQLHEY